MMSNRIALASIFLLICSVTYSFGVTRNWEKELSAAISKKLKAQIHQNELNEKKGLRSQNKYLIELSGDEWKNKKDWIEERGEQAQQIFTDGELSAINTQLLLVNDHNKLVTASTALYVVVVNNWKLYLKTTLSPAELGTLKNFDQFKNIAHENLYNDVKEKMAIVPLNVEADIKSEKSRSTIYVYLFSRFTAYDNPNGQDVKKHQFIYTSFTESPVRYKIKSVTNMNHSRKGQFLIDNIHAFGKYFIEGSEKITLAYNNTIPTGERQTLQKALIQEVRFIPEVPEDRNKSVYDYTNLLGDDAKVNALEQASKDLRTSTGGSSVVFQKIFYTDYRMEAKILNGIKDYVKRLSSNDLVFWIHLNENYEVTAGIYFGPGLEERISRNFIDKTKEFLVGAFKVHHKFSSIPFQGLSWVAGTLSKFINLARIDAIYYDPSLGDKYDPSLFTLYYITRTTTTVGSGIIVNTIASDEDNFAEKITDAIKRDSKIAQLEFAFVTGLWNGVIREIKGLPDVVKLLSDVYTDPPSIQAVADVVNAILLGKAYDAIAQQVKDRYNSEKYSQHAVLHHSAEDIIAVAALFAVVGEITGAAKTSAVFAKIAEAARVLDFIALSRYAVTGITGLYRLALVNGKYFIKIVGQETKLILKLANEAGSILKNTDLSLMRQVVMRGPSGNVVHTIFVDPSEVVSGKIIELKNLVQDTYSNKIVEFTDDAGKSHVGVEVSDASKVVDGANDIATEAGNASKLTERIRDLYDNLIKAGFKAFDDGAGILFRNADNTLIAKISDDALHIKIPDNHGTGGWATQSTSINADNALKQVNEGAPLYRIGTLNRSAAAEAQYWSLENPLDIKNIKDFATKYGIPESNLETGQFFIEIAKPIPGMPRISRGAPAFGNNQGGSIEIVVPTNGVKLESFHTIKF